MQNYFKSSFQNVRSNFSNKDKDFLLTDISDQLTHQDALQRELAAPRGTAVSLLDGSQQVYRGGTNLYPTEHPGYENGEELRENEDEDSQRDEDEEELNENIESGDNLLDEQTIEEKQIEEEERQRRKRLNRNRARRRRARRGRGRILQGGRGGMRRNRTHHGDSRGEELETNVVRELTPRIEVTFYHEPWSRPCGNGRHVP